MVHPALLGAVATAAALMAAACGTADYAVRPLPQIAADSVGKPVQRLQEAFGEPRKIDDTPTKQIYVWYLPQSPPGAPAGFHGCELEVSVDFRSDQVIGYSLTNLGWTACADMSRKVRVKEVPVQ